MNQGNRHFQKTAGYHRRFYHFLIFVKEGFEKTKTFFFLRKTLSSSKFLNCPSLKRFWLFCRKNLIIAAQKTFLRNSTNWHAFYSKFATYGRFEKINNFFSKKPICSSKRYPPFEHFEKVFFFSRIKQQLGYNLVKKNLKKRERNWQNWLKKVILD